MSSLRTKHAPLAPSSILLDKRWKEHDYLQHQYRLRSLRGNPLGSKPSYPQNESHQQPVATNKRATQSAKNAQVRSVYIQKPTMTKKRPKTSKEEFGEGPPIVPLKQRWVKSPLDSARNSPADFRSVSSASSTTSNATESPWARKRDEEDKPSAAVKPMMRATQRPKSSHPLANNSSRPKTGHPYGGGRPKTGHPSTHRKAPSARLARARGRPITAKYDANGHLINRQTNPVRPRVRPIKSDYSLAAMKKHYERHQYYRNGILQRQRIPRPETNRHDDYSDFFESESEELSSTSSSEEAPTPSPLPSPTPTPPIREPTPLYIESRFASVRTPTLPPMQINNQPPAPAFVPPSHVLKLVRDAEYFSSDSSISPDTDVEGEQERLYKKDGCSGMFKRDANGDYVRVDIGLPAPKPKEVPRKVRRHKPSERPTSRVRYVMYSTDEDENPPADEKKVVTPDVREDYASSSSDITSDAEEVKKALGSKESSFRGVVNAVFEEGIGEHTCTQACPDECPLVWKIGEGGGPEDDALDAKQVFDSGSDLDEFGRRRIRERPSSSIYDYLPPLNPDPVLDDDDVNKCKERLMRNVVSIHDGMLKNTYEELEKVASIIIMNNNDNRRWLRKFYREEYLKSLMVDLRKCFPAYIASVISNMMIPPCEYDAMCLWDALKGMHKDPEVVIEILTTRSNRELEKIREAYKLRYDDELLDHIEDETIGVFQRLLMKLVMGKRDNAMEWNREDAENEARAISALLESGGDYLDKKICDVFTRLPLVMIRAVFAEYIRFKSREMDVDIVRVLKGNYCRCVLSIIQYVTNAPSYFVQKIHTSHYASVDDDKTLCRILVSRAETDLEMIKQQFFLRYGMEMFDYMLGVCNSPLKGLIARLIANLFSLEERNERKDLILPVLYVDESNVELPHRLTMPDAIRIILRKTKVVNKFIKILFAKRERARLREEALESLEEETSSEEGDVKDGEDSDEDAPVADLDSEEEERREAQEAQRQLRNGLKNISFADDGENDPNSTFKGVSFAQASRGILKKSGTGEDDGEEVEESQEAGGIDEQPIPLKTTQLNGPVIDPTFIGRETRRGLAKLKPRKFLGTVKGISMTNFDALKDAQAIGKSLLQKNRNTEGILQFLTSRNNAQRQLIIREFFRRYRRDLVDDIRALAPQYEEIVLALLLSSQIYDAASLYGALIGDDLQTKIDVLLEILCTRQNDEIAIIKRAFSGVFNMDLHEEVDKIVTGHFKTLLQTIIDCQREQNDLIDQILVNKDSQRLFEAMAIQPTNYEFFIELFGTRKLSHIGLVCDALSKITDMDILETLDESVDGCFLEGITSLICSVRDAPVFFCERIYRAMTFNPPDFTMLIRCIIVRSEVDLQTIKAAFRRTYGTTIYAMVDQLENFKSRKILLDIIKK